MEVVDDKVIYKNADQTRLPSLPRRKEKCPDCLKCQMCSESRCGLCRKGSHKSRGRDASDLGTSFTYGQYVEWKKKREAGQ
jgi:hypothetical protein